MAIEKILRPQGPRLVMPGRVFTVLRIANFVLGAALALLPAALVLLFSLDRLGIDLLNGSHSLLAILVVDTVLLVSLMVWHQVHRIAIWKANQLALGEIFIFLAILLVSVLVAYFWANLDAFVFLVGAFLPLSFVVWGWCAFSVWLTIKDLHGHPK